MWFEWDSNSILIEIKNLWIIGLLQFTLNYTLLFVMYIFIETLWISATFSSFLFFLPTFYFLNSLPLTVFLVREVSSVIAVYFTIVSQLFLLIYTKLCNQVPSLDHFVVQNSGDFLCWKYKEVVCFYVSNLLQ